MFKDLFNKISFTRFFMLSLPMAAACLYLLTPGMEWTAFAVCYVATVLYLVMFWMAVDELIKPHRIDGYKANGKYLAFLFIGKLVILIGALLFGVQILQSKIIIPVINYFLNIFVLGASIKKD
ncbi:hypothetical protein ABMA70_09285 [Halobacteriovorax sp. XZX-3]|uniref:hypothetical protein n=1 Tax=unclassified Halobacteriovorax TaxID=2639665 RepID=UPI003711AC95